MQNLTRVKKIAATYIFIGIVQCLGYLVTEKAINIYVYTIIAILVGASSIIAGKKYFSDNLNVCKLFISNGTWLMIGVSIFCLLNAHNEPLFLIPLSIIMSGVRLYLVSVSYLDKNSLLYGQNIYLPSAYCIMLLLLMIPNFFSDNENYSELIVKSNSVKEILINGEAIPFVDGYIADVALNSDTAYIDVQVLDGWEIESVTYAVVDDISLKILNTKEETHINTVLSKQMISNANQVDLLEPVKTGKCTTYFYINLKNAISQEFITHVISCNAYDTLSVYCEKITFKTALTVNKKIYIDNDFVETQQKIEFALKPFNTDSFYNRKTLAVALLFAIGQYNAEAGVANGYQYEIIDDIIYIKVRKDSAITNITFESAGEASWVKMKT